MLRSQQYEMLDHDVPLDRLGRQETSYEPTFQNEGLGKQRGFGNSRSTSRWRKLGNSLWLLEFGSWLLGFGSLAAIVGVLIKYDGRTVPSLAYGITLGALVSVLSTIATVFLTAPLAAGIGQARWIWFRKNRRLADFELITEASRSPLSAFELICRWKGGFLTMFGAFFIIAVLAINPFVQQVIKYDSRPLNHTTAMVPIANTYNVNPIGGVIPTVDVGLTMKAAILRGLLQVDANNTVFDVNPRCATGNCSWSQYGTLSVCGRCADLTKQLSPVNSTNRTGERMTSLPNGLSLTWPNSLASEGLKTMTINNTLASAGLRSIAFTNVNYSIADVFAIIGQWGDNNGPYAAECVLQFCAQNMTAISTNGIFTETAMSKPLYLDQMYNGSVYTIDGNMNWTVEYETWNGLTTYFSRLFSSFVQQANSLSPISLWPDDVSQTVFHYFNTTSHGLDGLFNDLASSMGQYIRAHSDETFTGQATSQESFVEVRWQWMILPLIILAAVLIFLIASMIATKSAGLKPWKESSTAVLFHGLNDEGRADLLNVNEKWEMDQIAGNLQMHIEEIDGGLNLRVT